LAEIFAISLKNYNLDTL